MVKRYVQFDDAQLFLLNVAILLILTWTPFMAAALLYTATSPTIDNFLSLAILILVVIILFTINIQNLANPKQGDARKIIKIVAMASINGLAGLIAAVLIIFSHQRGELMWPFINFLFVVLFTIMALAGKLTAEDFREGKAKIHWLLIGGTSIVGVFLLCKLLDQPDYIIFSIMISFATVFHGAFQQYMLIPGNR